MRNYKPVALEDRIRFTPEQQDVIDWDTLEKCKEQLQYLTERGHYLKRKMSGVMTDSEEKLNADAYKNNSLLVMFNKSIMADILDGTHGDDDDDEV